MPDPCRARGEEPNVGVILLTVEVDNRGGEQIQEDMGDNAHHVHAHLWCAFTTQSMAIGYCTKSNPTPKVCTPPALEWPCAK